MSYQDWGASTRYWCLFFFWISGGVVALLLIARREQKRLGGEVSEAVLDDLRANPLPACVGYLCVLLIGSWMHVTLSSLAEWDYEEENSSYLVMCFRIIRGW